jgi:phosphatidylglycerol:prolipoprotein diacylglycerol transferase
MLNLAYITWDFSPSVIPSFDVPRWYGIMWALGYLIGLKILERMFKSENINKDWADKTFLYVLIGGILGARLGHLFFYEPWFDQLNVAGQVVREGFLSHPLSILKIWEGGLASHGGVIGILIAAYLLSRNVTKKNILWIVDRIAVPTALAASLIRFGNLFNSEIVGKETTSSIGFKFIRHDLYPSQAMGKTGINSPNDAYDAIANNPIFADILASIPVRYPTQLIEAICYLGIFAVMLYFYWKTNAKDLLGFLVGVFFFLLFMARFFIEYLKIPQGGTDLGLGMLNTGQKLSIPLMAIGLFLVFRQLKKLKRN